MFFPASGSFWLFLPRAPFSLTCYFPNLWLDVLITLVLFLRHSIEMPSWHNYKNTFEMWLPITALLQILNCHKSQSQQHCHISYVLSHTLSQQLIKPALKLAWKKTTRNDKYKGKGNLCLIIYRLFLILSSKEYYEHFFHISHPLVPWTNRISKLTVSLWRSH